MKRSLNNRFKGKRLVEGNENEITAHELLLKEEDDKIVVKGRGSSGNVEVLSGGNNDSEIYMEHYLHGSNVGGPQVDTVYRIVPFTNLFDFNTNLNTDNYYESKGVIVPIDKSIQMEYCTEDSSESLSIKVPSGATGIANDTSGTSLLFMLDYYNKKIDSRMLFSRNSFYSTSEDPMQITVILGNEIVYEASTNILYYYSSTSEIEDNTIDLTINPELAESLKIYEVNTYYGGGHYKFRINGGSSTVTTENIADSIDK